jgi:TetR/AcrR family transcriptional regulator, transcriptional repressor of bet genes
MATAPKYSRLTSEDRRAALEEAALACMARGGILEFTIDKVCKQAGVSRGLITHHFQSKDGLLVAVYANMYARSMAAIDAPRPGMARIVAMIDASFAPDMFSREVLNIWLTLWGEIANNPVLQAEHRRQYAGYVADVTAAIDDIATARALTLDSATLARAFIALVDGLGLQRCIEPRLMTPKSAKDACYALLEPHLGKL